MHECTWCCYRCWCDGTGITQETRQPRDCLHFTGERPCVYVENTHTNEDEGWEGEDDR
jgi:hypothetical protein